nr:prepilin-type N-terminal cleavage/methylation domain-containing protein [uncultured Deefgea sp.]
MKHQSGFTLVELAIVLVIIGLILGAAFKGKDLIDGAKVKNLSASYNKVTAAFNSYFDKYGNYPGDACAVGKGATDTKCTGTKNGSLDATEAKEAMDQLVTANVITSADLKSVFGTDWVITAGSGTAPFDANTNYMQPGTGAVDARLVCALDQQIDDGNPVKGIVRAGITTAYTKDTDCWGLASTATMGIRVLP